MYHTYIIISSEKNTYIGHTGNLNKRLSEHNSGLCKSTKNGKNWQIIYSKEFSTRSDAMRHEKWLKSGVGRDYIKKNILDNG